MLTGRKALRNIDNNIAGTRRQLQKLSGEIDRARIKLMGLRSNESNAYKRLASLRVQQIANDPGLQDLDRAEKHVRDLLNSRETALHALVSDIEASADRQGELEDKRQNQADVLADAAERLDQQQAKTQSRLADDEGYQEQIWAVERADSMAKHAEEKTLLALEDEVKKGEPYKEDALFMYLWERGYGTSRYKAWPLVRFLDGWVARLIRFETARVNYNLLTQIPQKLSLHADGLRDSVQQETQKLIELEQKAAQEDGIPALAKNVDDREKEMADLDAALEEEEQNYADLLQQQSKFDRGEDPYFGRAVDVIVEELKKDSFRDLKERARQTPEREDDQIISELDTIDSHRDELAEHIKEQEQKRRGKESRLHELEAVRRRFKSHHYDAVNSQFPDSRDFDDSLGGFLGGILSSDEFWRVVKSGQRFRRPRSQPVFGSGGFKGRRSSNVWKNSGWGGRGGGGGFKTGGGF